MATNSDQNDTNTLYFIVGGLVVLALIMSFVYLGNENIIARTEPSAGTTTNTTNNYRLEVPADDTAPAENMAATPAEPATGSPSAE